MALRGSVFCGVLGHLLLLGCIGMTKMCWMVWLLKRLLGEDIHGSVELNVP